MKRFLIPHPIVLFATLVMLFSTWSNAVARQDVSSYESLNSQLVQAYKSDEKGFRKKSISMLTTMPDNGLWDILTSSRYDLLRIAAYNAIVDRSEEFQPRATVFLLMYSESLGAFDLNKGYVDANAFESEDLCDELTQLLKLRLSEKEQLNCDILLRMLPLESVFRVLDDRKKHMFPATNIALIINALFRHREAETGKGKLDQKEIDETLLSLKFSPGKPQLTFVYYFSFQKPRDALPHLAAIMSDNSLATPEVLIAMGKHTQLVISNEGLLTAEGDLEIAVSRFREFRKRFTE
jgi:hypothetical protein